MMGPATLHPGKEEVLSQFKGTVQAGRVQSRASEGCGLGAWPVLSPEGQIKRLGFSIPDPSIQYKGWRPFGLRARIDPPDLACEAVFFKPHPPAPYLTPHVMLDVGH